MRSERYCTRAWARMAGGRVCPEETVCSCSSWVRCLVLVLIAGHDTQGALPMLGMFFAVDLHVQLSFCLLF